MRPSFFALLFCLYAARVGASEEAPRVPAEFLNTTIPGWRRILDAEVTLEFRATPLRDALALIFRHSDANLTVTFATGAPPVITRKLVRIPFRTALYLLARDSNATVSWELMPGGQPRGIEFVVK